MYDTMARRLPALRRFGLTVRYTWLRQLNHVWTNVFRYKPITMASALSYDEYWDADASVAFANDLRAIAFEEVIEHGASVADIGCGDGGLLARLQKSRNASVHGFDVSSVAVARARAKGVPADLWNASTDKLPGTFDYVVIADCMEHVPVPEQLVEGVRSGFRKALLISIPNSCYWRYRFRVLFGSFMVQWVAHPGEHLRFWSISDMRWWLGQLGYTLEGTRPTWGIPVLKHLWPAMFAQNVVYIVRHTASSPQ